MPTKSITAAVWHVSSKAWKDATKRLFGRQANYNAQSFFICSVFAWPWNLQCLPLHAHLLPFHIICLKTYWRSWREHYWYHSASPYSIKQDYSPAAPQVWHFWFITPATILSARYFSFWTYHSIGWLGSAWDGVSHSKPLSQLVWFRWCLAYIRKWCNLVNSLRFTLP